ncbi:MAG TPA: hypothetical protein VD887_13630 [Allosphingosinicella sp.]|nr:hypothetical protein [Allosphingosinicella sp.]HYG31241.1 hypothetical protein [Allosphingosinicella sp.]
MRSSTCLIALSGLALAALPAAAALPPNHQRLAELRAVLGHAGVVRAFGTNEPIDRVEYVRHDLYRVTSGRCHMDVAIVGLPTPARIAGPRRFEARPGRKVCGGGGRR